jgi:hypothetical protein
VNQLVSQMQGYENNNNKKNIHRSWGSVGRVIYIASSILKYLFKMTPLTLTFGMNCHCFYNHITNDVFR